MLGDKTPVKKYNHAPSMRTLEQWHGGQSSASYAVLSSWVAGKSVDRGMVRQCVEELGLVARDLDMHGRGLAASELRNLCRNLSIHASL